MATERKHLSLRGFIIGLIGSVVITMSSTYVALRLGALPWPTIFVAILSMVILRALGNTNAGEITVTHTAMSTGGLVAGGVAFTIPAIWMLNPDAVANLPALFAVTLSGTILGLVFTVLIRHYFIDEQKLPFPMGQAAAQTVQAGLEGGGKAARIFVPTGLAALFTALRDQWALIPPVLSSAGLAAKNIFFGIWMSPMAVGIGYIIGPLYMGTWLAGGILSYFFLIPVGVSQGWFADLGAAEAFKNSAGIGMIIGAGIGILVKSILPRAKDIFGPVLSGKTGDVRVRLPWLGLTMAVIVAALVGIAGIPLVPSILLILGVWVVTSMAAAITGQTGIDPMEIFGIIVLLFVKIFADPGSPAGVYIAAVAAIAAAIAGDALQDFKAGALLKTDPKAQFIGEAMGGIVGAFVSVGAFFIMKEAYGKMGPGTDLLAPQAYGVSLMVAGLPNPGAFYGGLGVGFILYLIGIPAMTLGIGMYLPMIITTAAALGGIIKLAVGKFAPKKDDDVQLAASGFLGGEGVTGMVIAIVQVLTRG